MRDALLERVWREMRRDRSIFVTCADFGSPILDNIRGDFPDRFVNVGIAEQNLINISAGLALEGYKVFAYAIAPFITMRCYEQTRVNLALLSTVRPMNVTLIGVGAGYSYVVSGPTHQCYEDITLMRAMPNMRVLSPSDHVVAAALFDVCHAAPGLKYVRLDAQILQVVYSTKGPDIPRGFHIHRTGGETCFVATGYMLHTALAVADALGVEGIPVGVIDLFDLSVFARDDLQQTLMPYRRVISMEEGFKGCGGMDALLAQFLRERDLNLSYMNIGVEGGYQFELGSRDELHEQVGIGRTAIMAKCKEFIGE